MQGAIPFRNSPLDCFVLRFIAETFDMNVDWQKDWKMVNMEEKQ